MEWRLLRFYRGRPTSWAAQVSSGTTVVWRIHRGEAWGKTPQGTYRAGPGQWLLHLPGQRDQFFTRDSRIDSVQLQLRWRSGAQLLRGVTPLALPDREIPDLTSSFERLLPFADEQSRLFTPCLEMPLLDALDLRARVSCFIRACIEAGLRHGWAIQLEKEIDPRVRWMIQQLESHPLDQPLDLSRLANELRLSRAHSTRLFLEIHGVTPRQFFEERRLEFARQQLLAPQWSVKEVAGALGFTSLQRFSVWFKTLEGVAPRVYRGE